MPRQADLLSVAHTVAQRVDERTERAYLMQLHGACAAAGIRSYVIDILAGRTEPPEVAAFPYGDDLPTRLPSELETALARHGFRIAELSAACVTIRIIPREPHPDYDVEVSLTRYGRTVVRRIDALGKVLVTRREYDRHADGSLWPIPAPQQRSDV